LFSRCAMPGTQLPPVYMIDRLSTAVWFSLSLLTYSLSMNHVSGAICLSIHIILNLLPWTSAGCCCLLRVSDI